MPLGSSGDEVRTAVVKSGMPTGGLTNDQNRISASEDRAVVGIQISKTFANGGVEVSFSSTAAIAGVSDNKDTSRSPVVFYMGEQVADSVIEPGEPLFHWDDGEELHFHTRNNSGTAEGYRVVIYYLEE